LIAKGQSVAFAEVFRCLKRGGVFRVATPDLMKYVGLFAQTRTPEQQSYMKQASMF
jgi:predicted SAM-dependent methyltransferase